MKELIITFSDTYQEEKKYIANVIFNDFWGIPYQLIFKNGFDKAEISMADSPVRIQFPEILFSTKTDYWLKKESLPASPLRIRKLDDLNPHHFYHNSVPVIYGEDTSSVIDLNSDTIKFDIDIFGSIFFCLTLYEEVGSDHRDEFGRFPFHASILVKEKIKHRPIVNEYLEILFRLLQVLSSEINRKERSYRLNITHDVDKPRAHDFPFKTFLKDCAKDVIMHRSGTLLMKRVQSRFIKEDDYHKNKDPFNTFKFLMDVSDRLGLISEFNFIVIDGKGSVDGAYDIESKFIKQVMKNIHHRGHLLGFHPSFYTFCDVEKTQQEFHKFIKVCKELGIQQEQYGGRQHYLRWKNPDSWRIWDQIGADFDSSVGWKSISGFRSGTCFEYPVFDLISRKQLKLRERSLHVMEISQEECSSEEDFRKHVIELSKACKHYQGELVLLFHNDRVLSPKHCKDYEDLLENLV
ncbi:hypothetical protein C3K47_13605 [Solitalea longa]|uniref:DUF7033 domain-containing protein n=1 Tax=Solitalea longa TaxID=2079460 RepID=A0A2S5A0E3_9SPHI|nr:hypothetical protein [Solitalea longa]POY35789.1 hypothetical protein C3K47_13605 [Solitalea longa]